MEENKYRHEYKHYINEGDYISIRNRLNAIADKDLNAGASGKYFIRSLYLDTPGDKALNEKLDGVAVREKFRIRMYNGDYAFIRIEKKCKVNNFGRKEQTVVSRQECQRIIDGDIGWMMDTDRVLLQELYAKMKYERLAPKTIVDYYREPFVFEPGNVRITFDTDIRTGLYSKDFFNDHLTTLPISQHRVCILEVKYDEFIPDIIRNAIQSPGRAASAFSKYGASRIFG